MNGDLLLGAHVSSAGGVSRAPARGAEIGAAVIQIFTKPVHRWAEPPLAPAEARAFRSERQAARLRVAGSHDSYLINLASADRALFRRSVESFRHELRRAAALELDFVVTHPGNATAGDRESALERNADAIAETLAAVPGAFRLLLEGTAGQGSALGASFDEVFAELDATTGPGRLGLLHLNDSKARLGSHLDRHEHIGKGALGDRPFRRILTDPRFAAVPKVLETPKGDDPVRWDRRNLRRLRSFAADLARSGRAMEDSTRTAARRRGAAADTVSGTHEGT